MGNRDSADAHDSDELYDVYPATATICIVSRSPGHLNLVVRPPRRLAHKRYGRGRRDLRPLRDDRPEDRSVDSDCHIARARGHAIGQFVSVTRDAPQCPRHGIRSGPADRLQHLGQRARLRGRWIEHARPIVGSRPEVDSLLARHQVRRVAAPLPSHIDKSLAVKRLREAQLHDFATIDLTTRQRRRSNEAAPEAFELDIDGGGRSAIDARRRFSILGSADYPLSVRQIPH